MTDIETGDTVFHRPSEETWLVAFVEGGRLYACGWPCSGVPVEDCELIDKGTKPDRLKLLDQMADISGDDPRKSYALRVRAAALTPKEAE
jgi:hypothetical protein